MISSPSRVINDDLTPLRRQWKRQQLQSSKTGRLEYSRPDGSGKTHAPSTNVLVVYLTVAISLPPFTHLATSPNSTNATATAMQTSRVEECIQLHFYYKSKRAPRHIVGTRVFEVSLSTGMLQRHCPMNRTKTTMERSSNTK